MLRCFVTVVVLVAAGTLSAAPSIWIGFRYDATHVLIFTKEKRETSTLTQNEVSTRQLPPPIARWAGGGYLIAATPKGNEALAMGERATLALGGIRKIPVTVDRYLEQWGSSNPVVQTGALLRVAPDQLPKFHGTKADCFLVCTGESLPAAPVEENPGLTIKGTQSVLNRFGSAGELLLIEEELGWRITLWRRVNGRLLPTSVKYWYGD